MTDQYVIETVFRAQDQMSASVNAMTQKMETFGQQIKKAFREGQSGASQFKATMGGMLGANLISAGVGKLRSGFDALKEEFLGFDRAITSAASKYKFDRGTAEFEALGKAARDVAASTPYTAGQAAKALDFLAMAGFDASQAIAALPGVTSLAIAGDMDLAQASDIASDALGAFNMRSNDPLVLAKNLGRVTDVMAQVANISTIDMPMLWESWKKAAPLASQFGGSVESLGAMFTVLANSGLKAEEAGTSMRGMYLRLTSGVAAVNDELKKYHITLQDNKGQLRPMTDILEDINNKTKNLSDTTRLAALNNIFGAHSVNAALVLMKAGKGTIDGFQKQLENSAGAADDLARRIGESLSNRIESLKSELIEVGLKFVDAFGGKLPEALDAATEAVRTFDVKGMIEKIQSVVSTVKEWWGVIKDVIIALLIYKAIVTTVAAAQTLLNIAMAANPLGLLLIALTAVGFAIYQIYTNWEALVASMKRDALAVAKWLGLDGLENGVAETAYRQQEGYILGGKSAQVAGNVDAMAAMREQKTAGIADIFGAQTTATTKATEPGLSSMLDQAAMKKALEMDQEALQASVKGMRLSTDTMAAVQKIAFNGQLTFNNAPEGTTFEQQTTGAPPIKHNLGSNY